MSGGTARHPAAVAAPVVAWVRFVEVGFHHWPDAPPHRGYLAASHRHRFGVEARVAVAHDERDLEFHDMLDELRGPFRALLAAQDGASCEALARDLLSWVLVRWPGRAASVTVDEDGECGATVTAP